MDIDDGYYFDFVFWSKSSRSFKKRSGVASFNISSYIDRN